MALVRRLGAVVDPFFGASIADPFEIFSPFDRLLLIPDTSGNARMAWIETPDAHVIRADLPGVNKEEVKIQVKDDGRVSISGESSKKKVDEEDNYRRIERSYGKFYREFKLPENTKPDEITAKMENGVLTINVPKTEESKENLGVHNVDVAS